MITFVRNIQKRLFMFQFSCTFAFLSTFHLSNRTLKITLILTQYQTRGLVTVRHTLVGLYRVNRKVGISVSFLVTLRTADFQNSRPSEWWTLRIAEPNHLLNISIKVLSLTVYCVFCSTILYDCITAKSPSLCIFYYCWFICIDDSNVEELIRFSDVKPHRQLTYGAKQLIAREVP